MLGGISKMRPCGHHHYYKYAHAKNRDDLLAVHNNDTFIKDEIRKTFDFSLYNFDGTTSSLFGTTTTIEKFILSCPKITSMKNMFNMKDKDIEVFFKDMNWSNVENVQRMYYDARPKSIQEDFETGTTNFNGFLGNSAFIWHLLEKREDGQKYLSYFEFLDKAESAETCLNGTGHLNGWTSFYLDEKYKFENLKYAWAMFINNWPYNNTWLRKANFNLKSLISGNAMFQQNAGLTEFSSDEDMANLEDAQQMFACCNALTQIFPNRDSFSLPKLKKADRMFGPSTNGTAYGLGAPLDKPSILKLCNALPDWSSDNSTTYLITLSAHVDLANDVDVNLALKKVDMKYNEYVPLPEEVTKDKGWDMKMVWSGTSTENEVISPKIITLLDSSIQLPDGYTRLEYLKSNGTQYINTGYIPSNTTGLYVIAKQMGDNDSFSMGCGNKTSSEAFLIPRHPKAAGKRRGFAWGKWKEYDYFSGGFGKCHEGYLNFQNSRIAKMTIDIEIGYDVSVDFESALDTLSFTPTLPIYIFTTSHVSGTGEKWDGRIYRAKISEGTEIIHDYIPCLDANGKPCLYDILGTGTTEENTYYNLGTEADFTYKNWAF